MAFSLEQCRNARISLVLRDVLSKILHELLENSGVEPRLVYDKIQNKKSFKLYQEERKIVKTLVDSATRFTQLDISLSWKIGTFFGLFSAPSRDWQAKPQPTENAIGDDIIRIKNARNKYLHGVSMISEEEMLDFFIEFTEVGKRVDRYLTKKPDPSFERQIQEFQTLKMEDRTEEILDSTSFVEDRKGFIVFPVEGHSKTVKVYRQKGLTEYMEEQLADQESKATEYIPLVCIFPEINDNDGKQKAELLNSFKEEINKGQLKFVFTRAFEGSLILLVNVTQSLLEDKSEFEDEIRRFIERVFKLDEFKSLETMCMIITSSEDEVYADESGWVSEDDEDCLEETESDTGSLVLNFNMRSDALDTDEHFQESIQQFINSIVKTSNGKQLTPNNEVTAIIAPGTSESIDQYSMSAWGKSLLTQKPIENKGLDELCGTTQQPTENKGLDGLRGNTQQPKENKGLDGLCGNTKQSIENKGLDELNEELDELCGGNDYMQQHITSRDYVMNAKCILNEWKQQYEKDIEYRPQESGPDHEKCFRVNVYIDGALCGTGIGSRKKKAEQRAAISAVQQLGINTDFIAFTRNGIEADPKSQLNEKLQERHIKNIIYTEISRTGPAHGPTFTVQLFINDIPCAIGTGKSIQNADRSAARQILKQLDEGSLSFSDISDQDSNDENSYAIPKDAKCILNDWVQSRRKSISYEQANKYGPDHALSFKVDLYIGGEMKSSGFGTSLQRAELDAANKAVQQISKEFVDCYPKMNFPRYVRLPPYDELAMITHKTFESVTHNVIVSIDKESVVASIIMENCLTGQKTVLSLGSGNVFVDEESLENNGETVIDSHAEIVAKRGFQRVLYKEVCQLKKEGKDTLGMLKVLPNKRIALQNGIKLHLYISKAPCGDGSVFTLSQPGSHTDTGNIHLPIQSDKKQGLLRAKIARGEGAIPVSELPDDRLHKMSCSDKICKWNVLGLQGALLSSVMDSPLFLSSVVVGDVYNFNHLSRALCCRVKKQHPCISGETSAVIVNHPDIAISTICDLPEIGKSKPVSVNWNIVDDTTEVTNGRTGKVSPDLYLTSSPPDSGINSRLCKKELFRLYKTITPSQPNYEICYQRLRDSHIDYHKAKLSAEQYQRRKTDLYRTFIEKGYGRWEEREDVDEFSV